MASSKGNAQGQLMDLNRLAYQVARRVLGAKRKTYKEAQAEILTYLRSKGWDVKANLKVPNATNRDKTIRLFFKPQAIHLATEADGLKLNGAHSMHLDLRTATGEEVLKAAEKFAQTKREWARTAAWGSLPKGWTEESARKFWSSLVGDRKHKVTACMKKMEGKVDDPGAFCASLRDKIEGKGWRSER